MDLYGNEGYIGNLTFPFNSKMTTNNTFGKSIPKPLRGSVNGDCRRETSRDRKTKRKHPEVLKELEATISAVQSEETSVGSLMPDPQTMKLKATDTRQVKLTDSIVSFIANDLLPLSIVDSKGFHNTLSLAEPCFTTPSRKHISQTLIPQHTASVQDQLRSQMQQAQDICITVDLWLNRDMR
ncbi:UNVERIFIED_CONTAM: hypothetical protein FKN15_058009 [Acipenser sinensis]